MTYENCLKYAEQARKNGDEEAAVYWETRAYNKPGRKPPVEEEPKVEEKAKPTKKRGKK